MPDLSHDELRQAAEHLGYEWAMLLGARQADWHKLASSTAVQRMANNHGRTEVTLLHTRTIYEFLFFSGTFRYPDDVRATHFLRGADRATWEQDRLILAQRFCPSLTANWERLNKKLFHLSYKRHELETGWEPDRIVSELKAAFRHLCKLLGSELLLIHEGLLLHEVDPNALLAP
jgi:hypothetical protein